MCCTAGGRGWWPPVRVGGVAVQMWGDSVIFDSLTVGLVGPAVVAHALLGRRDTRSAHAFRRAIAQQDGSFVDSCEAYLYSKKLNYLSGRLAFNLRPLDRPHM